MKVAIKNPGKDWKWEELEKPDFQDFQKIVDGYIELVPNLYTNATMYCNEEGKILNLPLNFALYENADAVVPFDIIRGSVIMLGPIDEEGNETELSVELFYKTLDIIEDIDERLSGI